MVIGLTVVCLVIGIVYFCTKEDACRKTNIAWGVYFISSVLVMTVMILLICVATPARAWICHICCTVSDSPPSDPTKRRTVRDPEEDSLRRHMDATFTIEDSDIPL